MSPKVFISYSWSSQNHQELIERWAEQLIADGVDVVLDLYDLKEGQDKYAFMERMVTDSTVTHVLLFSDKMYSEKADARKAGVGTESQIISREMYEKVEQSKFVPIVCEFDDEGNPFLPTFLKSRIWIDFSSDEATNHNWERLIRLLFGKPLHEKPLIGKPPLYITDDDATPSSPALSKYNALRQAVLQDKKGISLYRRDFLDACIAYADSLRVRERPNVESLGEKVLEDCGKLKYVRNHIVDWVLLESEAGAIEKFTESLLEFLERLRALKSRPEELNSWNEVWFEAHALFVYETFLYIVAALIKTQSYAVLHRIFINRYLLPDTDRWGGGFSTFGTFYAHSETLKSVFPRLYSPAAELIKRQADRDDIRFEELVQADLLILLLAFITPDTNWYPQTLHYASRSYKFPLFLRAAQHGYFLRLATIAGINDANQLREAVEAGFDRLHVNQWVNFHFIDSFWELMNMDKLDSLK